MAIPKVEKQHIEAAIKYIDENGVPERNKSTVYDLVTEDGKKYPPKYVISVAEYIANGGEIKVGDYNAVEAVRFLRGRGFKIDVNQAENELTVSADNVSSIDPLKGLDVRIDANQAKYELMITADNVSSTDSRFTMDNLDLGNNYKPLEVYFVDATGTVTRRKRNKSENKISNLTLPRLACQIFEKQLGALSKIDREQFPIYKSSEGKWIRGIYSTKEEFKQVHQTTLFDDCTYTSEAGYKFVFYSWNLFSTICFVKECLIRFGKPGDKFVLVYRDKADADIVADSKEVVTDGPSSDKDNRLLNEYSKLLLRSKNIILRGAPGTGKSYLAKEIAANIITDGYENEYSKLTAEQRKQVEFVQFHPSYDYSDFVEGLRPVMNEDGTMGFELRDGIFKQFITRARANYEASQKSIEEVEKEISAQEAIAAFFENVKFEEDKFNTITGIEFCISNVTDKHVYVTKSGNDLTKHLTLNMSEIRKLVESGQNFEKVSDITKFFGKNFATQGYSYEYILYKEIIKRKSTKKAYAERETEKKYIFIIDEINRGEISKILGELFFSIDPGYRGVSGAVSTQYANMHEDEDEKFYIPDNVYIIGTMNDIDRSVDSFDFAMQRRFRFVGIKANDRLEMLESLNDSDKEEEAIKRMTALNNEIVKVDDLDENYQIGAAYFLKLKEMDYDELWTDSLEPLLQSYVRGMYDEKGIMKRFADAYGYKESTDGESDESI